ncbi:MAG: hypothetical protein V3S98_06170 [Dehalococcoidia bacterium]
MTPNTLEAARSLAIPTIRSILRKRRNAIKRRKPFILAVCNADLHRAIRAALMLGLSAESLSRGTTQHTDDSRVLVAVVTREAAAVRVYTDNRSAV